MWYDIFRTYQLAVEKVLFDHDGIDGLWVFEGEEAEATRTTGSTIAHHLAVDYFAVLREVIFERFCCDMISMVQSLCKVLSVYILYLRSVVSQLRPPMNIFLQASY